MYIWGAKVNANPRALTLGKTWGSIIGPSQNQTPYTRDPISIDPKIVDKTIIFLFEKKKIIIFL